MKNCAFCNTTESHEITMITLSQCLADLNNTKRHSGWFLSKYKYIKVVVKTCFMCILLGAYSIHDKLLFIENLNHTYIMDMQH